MHPRAPPVLGCGGASPPSSGQAAPLPSRPGAWMKRAAIWEELRAASGQDPGRNRGHSPTPLGQGILPTAACEQLEHRKPKLPTESQSLCWQSWSPEAPCLRGFLSPQNLSWAWRFQSGPARDPGPGTNRRRHAPDSAGRVSRLRRPGARRACTPLLYEISRTTSALVLPTRQALGLRKGCGRRGAAALGPPC